MAVAKKPSGWRSRIVGHGEEAPDQLLANPLNWRIHPQGQQAAIATVLDQVGWVQDVIVNRTTGHVIDGHMRVGVAISRGEASVPVVYVELSEAEEKLILASLDPLGSMAVTDDAAFASLLADLQIDSDDLGGLLDGMLADGGGLVDATRADGSHTSAARGLGSSVSHTYNLVFESEEDLQRWYGFMRRLRRDSGDGSVASELLRRMADVIDV